MQIIAIIASNMNGKEYFMRILKTTVVALAMLAELVQSDSDGVIMKSIRILLRSR